ncbi:hypothetical protein RA28_05520 [Ruegeria sp. ANG-S4]|nr:hypothetical protein RA28_05520 [Ruegeria sp. ANG-S4]
MWRTVTYFRAAAIAVAVMTSTAAAQGLERCAPELDPRVLPHQSMFLDFRTSMCTWPVVDNFRIWDDDPEGAILHVEIGVEVGAPDNPAGVEAIANAIRHSMVAARLLGSDIDFGKVLKLVVSKTRHPKADGESFYRSGLNWSRCNIAIGPNMFTDDPLILQRTVAHEIFHCIVRKHLGNSFAGRGLAIEPDPRFWYLEGSADWFGQFAIPNAPMVDLVAFEFWADEKDFTELEYTAWPFFAWMSAKDGPSAILPFMKGIARDVDNAREINRLMEPERWYDFAKLYSAYHISLRDGRSLSPSHRNPRASYRLDEDQTLGVEVPLGKLMRTTLILAPGQWRLVPKDGGTIFLSDALPNGDPDGSWIPIDSEVIIDTRCDEDLELVLVSFGVDKDTSRYSIRADRVGDTCRRSCSNLPTAFDECLVGRWRDDTWVPPTESTVPGTEVLYMNHPPPVWTFYPGGLFRSDQPFASDVIARDGANWVRTQTVYNLNAALGYWGSSGPNLYVCEDRDVARGYGDFVTSDGHRSVGSLDSNNDLRLEGQDRHYEFEYICGAEELRIRGSVLGSISGRFTRISPAPEIEEGLPEAPTNVLPVPATDRDR